MLYICTVTVKMTLAGKGLTLLEKGGVKCVPRGVILTVIGCGLMCKNRDQRSYIAEPYDLHSYTGKNDKRLCLHQPPAFLPL